MKQNVVSDLGSVQIHKKVIAEIVLSSLKEIKGVQLYDKGVFAKVLGLLGQEVFPGLDIRFDKNQEVNLELKIVVQYGFNIPDVARQVQDRIKDALDRTVDINLNTINVNIQGIERGQK